MSSLEEIQIGCDDTVNQELGEELELHYSPSTTRKLKSKAMLLSAAIILMLLVLTVVTLSVTLPLVLRPNPEHAGEVISTTTEFQIKLQHVSKWQSRDLEMERWMTTFDEESSYFSLKHSTITTNIRAQYYVLTDGPERCGIDNEIRVREYISGPKNGITTIDIKGNKMTDYGARNMPFWPSQTYINNATQKCERDQHEQGHKYSRETRISLRESVEFKTCLDIAMLFPYAYDMKISDTFRPVEMKDNREYWMVQEYSGFLDNDTKFVVSFTIRYYTFEEAQNDENPKSGEWSIRLFALDEGESREYNKKVVEDITSAWHVLIDTYGNKE